MLAWTRYEAQDHCSFSAACWLQFVCGGGRQKIRDYQCDSLVALVLSHPRLWPFFLNEDVVPNNSTLSERELKETEEKRQAEEE